MPCFDEKKKKKWKKCMLNFHKLLYLKCKLVNAIKKKRKKDERKIKHLLHKECIKDHKIIFSRFLRHEKKTLEKKI